MGSASARAAFGSRSGRRHTCVAIGSCCGRCAQRCVRSQMSGLRCCSAQQPPGATTSARMLTCLWSCTILAWVDWLSWPSGSPGVLVARCSLCGCPRRRPRLCSWSTSSITGVYWSIEMIFGPAWGRLLLGGGALPVVPNDPHLPRWTSTTSTITPHDGRRSGRCSARGERPSACEGVEGQDPRPGEPSDWSLPSFVGVGTKQTPGETSMRYERPASFPASWRVVCKGFGNCGACSSMNTQRPRPSRFTSPRSSWLAASRLSMTHTGRGSSAASRSNPDALACGCAA